MEVMRPLRNRNINIINIYIYIYYRLNTDISCDNYLIIINIINNEVFDFHPYLHLEKQEACDGDNSITGNMTLSHDRGA